MIQISRYQQFIELNGLQKEFENFLQYSPDTTMYLKNKLKNISSTTEAWKNFVDDTDVVENVCGYIDESYDLLLKDLESDSKRVFREKFGKPGSLLWKEFQFMVIRNLKNDGCFNQLENKDIFDDDFEDSAGGCDEVVQQEAFKVLQTILK
jgi:hypothetical protein